MLNDSLKFFTDWEQQTTTGKLFVSAKLWFDMQSMILGVTSMVREHLSRFHGSVIKPAIINQGLVENHFSQQRGANGQNENPAYHLTQGTQNSVIFGQSIVSLKSNIGGTKSSSFAGLPNKSLFGKSGKPKFDSSCLVTHQRNQRLEYLSLLLSGCIQSYIGKTFRCLDDRLSEHVKDHQTSAIAQHFLECENAQFISNLNNLYDRLNNTHFHTNTTSCMKTLIKSNCKILYHNSVKNNQLLLLEALHIKFLKPELNSGLKASKDLTLFC